MLLGVLSDTHLDRLDGRLESLLHGPLGDAEAIVHAGDYVSPDVVDYLESVDPRPFYGVAGNMDPARVVARLPAVRTFEIGGLRVGLTHGAGAPAGIVRRVVERFDPLPDLVIFGHSHQPLSERMGGCLLVNPGSAFDRRHSPSCTVAIVKIEAGEAVARILEVGPRGERRG